MKEREFIVTYQATRFEYDIIYAKNEEQAKAKAKELETENVKLNQVIETN